MVPDGWNSTRQYVKMMGERNYKNCGVSWMKVVVNIDEWKCVGKAFIQKRMVNGCKCKHM